jgi:hypothetical protein
MIHHYRNYIFHCEHLGYYSETNDSIFHLSHLDENQTIWDVARINSLKLSLAIIILFILAKFFNNRTRIIDIINTILISAIPLIIIMPVYGMSFFKNATDSVTKAQAIQVKWKQLISL